MIPWEVLGRERAPQGGELVLYHRDGEFVIRVDDRLLMSSREHGSEESLAHLGCGHLRRTPRARVLIGGLGLGYTLRAALSGLPADATVVVAELVPAVIAWNRGPLAELAGRPLEDPRVMVVTGDVGVLLQNAHASFDAVLLDIDNGPEGLTRRSNRSLYGDPGLLRTLRAMRPGGVLAVWSATPEPAFARRLQRSGFASETHTVPARGQSGKRHTIFLGRAGGAARAR